MPLNASELILNADQSIYHLNLRPDDLAEIVITVGDPDRVPQISRYFDRLELSKGKREFLTHTGYYQGQRITVISTGIGTDNIDIVLNELDALANIDFHSGTVNPHKKSLTLIRLGTSGAIQADIPVDSFLLSEMAIGFDGLLHCYKHAGIGEADLETAFIQQTLWLPSKATPYVVRADESLCNKLNSDSVVKGFTATNIGFYGPQARQLRLEPAEADLLEKLIRFEYQGRKITNMEMETSAILALSRLLGHRAVSINAILANRVNGSFSKNPDKVIDRLIEYTLDKIIGV